MAVAVWKRELAILTNKTLTKTIAQDLVKNSLRHIKLPSVFPKTIFDNIELKISPSELGNDLYKIRVNDAIDFVDFYRDLRSGELNSALVKANVIQTLPSSTLIDFRNFMANEYPDVRLREIEVQTDVARNVHPDLEVTNIENLSETSKLKSVNILEKIKDGYLKRGLKILGGTFVTLGAIATVAITVDSLDTITKQMAGCFLVQNQPDSSGRLVAKACKIPSRSCENKENSNICGQAEYIKTIPSNPAILLQQAAKNTEIKKKIGIEEEITNENYKELLIKYMEKLKKYTYGDDKIALPDDPCGFFSINKGCIACDGYSSENSTNYVDLTKLPDGITLKCQSKGTLLEGLIDLSSKIGLKITKSVKDKFTTLIPSWVWIIGIIIIFLVIGGPIVLRFINSKK